MESVQSLENIDFVYHDCQPGNDILDPWSSSVDVALRRFGDRHAMRSDSLDYAERASWIREAGAMSPRNGHERQTDLALFW